MDFVAVAGSPLIGQLVKARWSELLLSIDWQPYVTRQETTITESEWVATGGLTLTGAFLSGSTASVEVAGGTAATICYIENRTAFADKSRDVFRIRCVVAAAQ